jgi:hypothetical protein
MGNGINNLLLVEEYHKVLSRSPRGLLAVTDVGRISVVYASV